MNTSLPLTLIGTTIASIFFIADAVPKLNVAAGCKAAVAINQSIDLSGNSRGAIQQTVNASAGSYRLTFALSGNSDGPPTIKTVVVSIGGVSSQFSFTTPANNNNNMLWVTETLDFSLPTSGNAVLSFQDISDGQSAYGAALDNIILTETQTGGIAPVPESGTFLAGALLLLPLGLSTFRIFWRNPRSAVP